MKETFFCKEVNTFYYILGIYFQQQNQSISGYTLLATSYLPHTACHILPARYYLPILPATYYLSHTACHILHVTHYLPYTACHILPATHCLPHPTCHILPATYYLPPTDCHPLMVTYIVPLTVSHLATHCLQNTIYHTLPATHYLSHTVCHTHLATHNLPHIDLPHTDLPAQKSQELVLVLFREKFVQFWELPEDIPGFRAAAAHLTFHCGKRERRINGGSV